MHDPALTNRFEQEFNWVAEAGTQKTYEEVAQIQVHANALASESLQEGKATVTGESTKH